MKIENFCDVLYNEAKKIGIELTSEQLIKFKKYKELLVEWNEKINLTAITDDYEIIIKHFIDCLQITKHITKNSNIIDVGTGAGFPGIVISIYFEENIKITLLDSLNKRLLFLQEVIDEIGLKNIDVIHGRAEDVANDINFREKYDFVVSRAVASLNVLLEYTTAYIKVKGKAIYMKGDNVTQEIEKSKKALTTLNIKVINIYNYEISINDETFNRFILETVKTNNTPKNYPRSFGKIKKNPL